MKKSFVGAMAFALALPLLSWLVLSSAQENRPGKKATEPTAKKGASDPPGASRFHPRSHPGPVSSSKIHFKTMDGRELRTILVDLPDVTDDRTFTGLRFHRPLFALAERDTPFEKGLPPVIDYIRREPNGLVLVRFRVIISSPEFLKQCRDAILDQERKLLAREHLTQDDINPQPWPLLHCVISIRDAVSREILGVSQTDTLTGTNEFTFTESFTQGAYQKLLTLIRSGDLDFVYTYSYVGETVFPGSVELKGVKKAKLSAKQKLRSAQVEGKEPIFQSEANEAFRNVYISVQKIVRLSHKDLIPKIDQPVLFQKLFADDGEITFKSLNASDEHTKAMLVNYLKPHLEQVRNSYSGEKTDITIHEDKEIKSTTSTPPVVSTGVNIPLPLPIPIALSLGISKSLGDPETKGKEIIDRVEKATGSKWAYDKATERWRPHSVSKLKFLNGDDQEIIDESSAAFISTGAQNGYLEEPPVPVTFTTKSAKVSRCADLGPYQGVPIGAMVPFFGAKLPKGYVWADGQANWPNADWVPVHLRGAKVPDMREYLVGGATNEFEVGRVYDKGMLTVPEIKISGSSFTLPAKRTQHRIMGGEGHVVKKGGLVAVVERPHDDNKDGKKGFWWDGWGGVYGFRDALYETFMPSEALRGEKIVKSVDLLMDTSTTNPRHVMCRWIIRVK